MRRMKILGLLLGSASLTLSLAATPALAVTPIEIAKRIGLSDAAIEQVKKGEVVVEELESSSDKDLSVAIVAIVEAPLARVNTFIDSGKLAEISKVTLAQGDIDTSTFSLAEMKLSDELLSQLAQDPGGTFFMSEDEAARVATAAKQGKAQALAAYQGVLSARAKAYWEGGAAAITPYTGKGRSPKVDLGHASDAAKELVQNPKVMAEIDAIPAKATGPAVHSLTWAIQKGRDQAAPVLSHHIFYKQKDADILIERRFYSAYDYDALQIVTGVLTGSDPNRSVVFYTTHTYTAQVAGFGGGAKRSIGRKLMQKELVTEMKQAQKAIAKD